MPPPPQQGGQGGDNSMAAMWIIVAVFVAAYFIWVGLRKYIVTFVLKVKLFELTLVDWFVSSSYSAKYITPAREQIYLMAAQAEHVQFQNLIDLSNYVGDFMKIPIAMVLFALAYVSYNSDVTLSFKKIYSMMSLSGEEKKNWPQITPVLKLGLGKIHCETGDWAMAMTPMQFCMKHDLIEQLPDVPGKLPGQNTIIKKGQANQLFALQLGKLWTGIDSLEPHRLALFAIFAARVNHEKGPAEQMLNHINRSSEGKKLDYTGAHKLAEKYLNTQAVQEVIARHAYEYTVLATLLSLARSDGVLASADFLWLKPLDRTLWFVLNNVGRQTPCVEVAGIFAHWFAELELRRKLYVPMVDEAVTALEIANEEVIYDPNMEVPY